MDFVNRLKFFMDSHGIAISQFADTCRIPRPTLSQILNGRNKKISDELIAKIHAAYPRLSVLWLMFGEGEMESATNMQFSEPQNQGSEAVSMPYSAINQPIQNPNDGPDSVTENQSENSASVFGGDNSLFSGQNLAPTQVAAQNQTADAPGSDRQPGFDDSLHGSIHFYNEIPDRPMRAPQPELYPQSGNIDTPFMTADHDDGSHDETTNETKATFAATSGAPLNGATMNAPLNEGTKTSVRATVPLSGGGSISLDSPGDKKITNIVVFYSDNSFQSFSPTA